MVTRADQRFAELVFRSQMCPKPEIAACLKQVHEEQQQGKNTTLAQLMVRKRVLTPAQVQQLQEMQRAAGSDEPPPPPGSSASAPGVKPTVCPVCDERLDPGVAVCPVCGTRPTELQPGGLELTTRTDEYECPKCGKVIARAAKYCTGCGTDFCPKCRAANDRGFTTCVKCGFTVERTVSQRQAKVKTVTHQTAVMAAAIIGAVVNLIAVLVLFVF